MNRLFLFCLGFMIWSVMGCSDNNKIPAGVMPREKMADVLWDMIKAERFTVSYVAKDSTKKVKAENFKLYAQVFAIHHITKEQFVKSYKFYMSRPDISRVMFDSLSNKANRIREDMFKEKTKADTAQHKPQPLPVTPTPTRLPKMHPNMPVLRHLKRDSLLKRPR